MMDLESAIQHCEEVAESKKKQVENGDWEKGSLTERDCIECASEHRQLAEWLKELKAYKEQSGDAISRQAAIRAIEALQRPIMREEANYYQFKFSGMSEAREAVENLPSVTPQHTDVEIQKMQEMEQAEIQKAYECGKHANKWIPVSERLPEKIGEYLVAQKTSFSDYVYRSIASYALNLHDVDEYDFKSEKRPGWYEYDSEWGYYEIDGVIAWMPLPQPYKAESEVEE